MMQRNRLRAALLGTALTLLAAPSLAQHVHNHPPPPMAQPAIVPNAHDHGALITKFKIDHLEHRWTDGHTSVNWDVQAWIGGDTSKIGLTSEGSKRGGGDVGKAEFQLLYSHMLSEFWDVQAGLRYDVRPEPGTAYGVIGLAGTAPYFIEVKAQAFVSEDGELSARLKAEQDLLITQRWVLQPSAEINLSANKVHDRDIGRGITDIGLGVRLRYEVAREIAPYIGFLWERKLGETADLARHHGEKPSESSVIAGIKLHF